MELSFDPFDLDSVDALTIKKYTSLFDVENWYSHLEDETFPTKFLPLSQDEIASIIFTYNSYGKKNSHDTEDEASKIAKKVIPELEKRIDAELAGTASFVNGAFARLSTRSPKDAVLLLPPLKNELRKELSGIPPGDENLDGIAWYCAVIRAMRVTTGKEVLNLLLNSSRVYQDLTRWQAATKENTSEAFPMNIILRQWQFIHPKDEFRAFVYNGHLTAVSQYIDVCYYEDLALHLEEVRRLISDYFYGKLQAKLPFQTCVLDLAIVDGSCKVIECNPYFLKTGAALFNWIGDKEILTTPPNPRENFAFRIIETKESRRSQGFMNVRAELEEKAEKKAEDEKKKENCTVM